MTTFVRFIVLFAFAVLADHVIKKYYGQKGLRLANLSLAVACGYWGLFHGDILSMAAAVWFLYAARPKEIAVEGGLKDADTGD